MSDKSVDLKEFVGRTIALSFNKKGILRYCGTVCFAEGIWCGIELDEADGNTDGTIMNVSYFSCKRNHGIFLQASEVINDLLLAKMTEMETEIVPLFPNKWIPKCDLSTTPDDVLTFDNDLSEEDSNLGRTFDILFQDVDLDESDESLGILPLHLLDTISDDFILDKSESITEEIHKLHINETFDERSAVVPMVKITSAQDILSTWNTINEDEILSDKSFIGNVTLDEAELTSHVLQEQENLNVTITVRDHTTETDELKKIEEKKNSEFSSPVCMVSKVLQIPSTKLYASPISTTPSSPRYASTPKPEGNSTFVLDEEVLSSAADFSPVSHMNKTFVEREETMLRNIFSQSEELDHINILSNTITLSSDTNEYNDSEKNILNVTCNIRHLDNYQNELNKTFCNAISDIKNLPVVKSHGSVPLNTTITFSEEYGEKDQRCEMKISRDYNEENILQYDKMIQTNVLKKTISLSEEVERVNLEKLIDSNTKVSGSFVEKKFECDDVAVLQPEIVKAIPKEMKNEANVFDLKKEHLPDETGKLNTTYEVTANVFDLKKEHISDETEILNTTYEVTDKLSRLPRIVKTPLKPEKQSLMKHPENVKSKIARRIHSVPSATVSCRSKLPELDKMKLRKSICIPSRSDNRDALNKKNRRQTFGSLSETGDSLMNPESPSLQNVQKQHPISQTISDSRSLKTKSGTSHEDNVHVPREYSEKGKENIKSVKKNLSAIAEVSLSSGFSAKKTGEVKYVIEKHLKQGKEFPQDETGSPTHLMSDAENAAISLAEASFLKQEFSHKDKTASSVKSSLRMQSKKSSIKTQENIARPPEKRVLLQKNEGKDFSSEPSVKQSLDKKTKCMNVDTKKGHVNSRIPGPVTNKEKCTEEKSNVKMQGPEKKSSKTSAPRRNLR